MTTSESWLRVTVFSLPVDQESGEEFVRSSVGESSRILKSQPGYAGGYWGDSPVDRTFGAVLHWSGIGAIEAAAEVLDQLKARRAGLGFTMVDVQNIRVTAVWREARQRSSAEDPGKARSVERPFQLPTAALVAGHPHAMRMSKRTGEVTVDTRLRIQYSHADDAAGLSYLRDTGAVARALMQAQPGFRLGYAGRIPATGAVAVISYWSSQEALDNAEPALATLQKERQKHGITDDTIRSFRLFALPAEVAPEMAGAREGVPSSAVR